MQKETNHNDNRPNFIAALNQDIVSAKEMLQGKFKQYANWSRKNPRHSLAALLGILVVFTGIAASLALVSQNTEVRKQAITGTYASCAGGTAHGVKACDSYRSYVVCNNGVFGAPTSCGDGKICSGGNCVNQQPVDCLSWDGGRTIKHGSCDDRNGTIQVCRYGVYHNPNPGECGQPPAQPPTQQPPTTTQQICTPNTKTCIGSYRIRTCSPDGSTESIESCPSGQQCMNNECKVPPATQNTTPTQAEDPPQALNCSPICTSATTLRTCNSAQTSYVTQRCGDNQICSDNACVNKPVAPTQPEQQPETPAQLPNATSNEISCTPSQPISCSNAELLKICGDDGKSYRYHDCGPARRCDFSKAECAPVVCHAGTVRCHDSRTLETCSPNGLTWMRSTCSSDKVCQNDSCIPEPVTAVELPDPQEATGNITCYIVGNSCEGKTKRTTCDSTQGEWDRPELCRLFLPLDFTTASRGTGSLEEAEIRGTRD